MSEVYNGCDTGEYIAVPGPQGPQGQRGAQGNPGPMGPMGPEGPAGVMGPQGCQGPKGDRGPRGEKGDKGDPGTPGERGPQGVEGPRGCNGKDGIVQWSEEISPEHIEQLRGPIGPTGPRGPRGERGIQGGLGPVGPAGATGPAGPAGPVGARGPQGMTGPQGLRGFTGPKGDPGDGRLIENMSNKGVWTSKQVADYALHGNTDWVEVKGHNLVMKNTQSGYVKNFKVWGKTLVNYCNFNKESDDVMVDTSRVGTLKKVIYTGNDEKNLRGPQVFTLLYKNSNVPNGFFGNTEKGILHLTIKHESSFEEPVHTKQIPYDIKQGVNKVKFEIDPLYSIRKIEVELYNNSAPQEEPVLPVIFNSKNFMILSGDWTNYVMPDYFWDKKHVGKPMPGSVDRRYYIDIESRNKNLIDESAMMEEFYIKLADGQELIQEERKQYIWSIATNKRSMTFLVHCAPNEKYILSFTKKVNEGVVPKILGFHDTPTNGENGNRLLIENSHNVNDLYAHEFTTGPNDNVIAIYLGELDATTQPLTEKVKYLQLEEVRFDGIGDQATSYQPYTSQVKKLILPRQLRDNEWLYWDEAKHRYMIHGLKTSSSGEVTGVEEIETPNEDEHLIHTFDGMTYIYIKSRIPTELDGEFPKKAHNDYYTKDQTYNKAGFQQYLGSELEKYYQKTAWKYDGGVENLGNSKGFLGLPNGVFLEWKVADLAATTGTGTAKFTKVEFDKIKQIIHAQITPLSTVGTSGSPSSNIDIIPSQLGIGVGANYNPSGRVKAYINVIAGNSDSGKKVLVLAIGTTKDSQS